MPYDESETKLTNYDNGFHDGYLHALEAVKNGNDSIKSLLAEAVGLLKRRPWNESADYRLTEEIAAFLAKVEKQKEEI